MTNAGGDDPAFLGKGMDVPRDPLVGMGMALAGALILAPDTMFMRLSGLSGTQMIAWRGLLMAAVLIPIWFISSRHRRADVALLATPAGLGAMGLQCVNATAFAAGIAMAPVAVILFAVATVPVWSVVFGALFLGDRIGRATALTSAVVIGGIGLSVSGRYEAGAGDPIIGVVAGLAVALALSGTFTIYRARPGLSILLTVGLGAGLGGLIGSSLAPGLWAEPSRLAAIAVTGAVILPASFYLLSQASRYTQASNVSLFLLLETVLGPVFVWVTLGEAIGPRGIGGGVIVVVALALYLLRERRITRSSA